MNIADDLRKQLLENHVASTLPIVMTVEVEKQLYEAITGKLWSDTSECRFESVWGHPYVRLGDGPLPEFYFRFTPTPDNTIESATKMMEAQRRKGLAKYGVSLEESGLGVKELIQHAREEAADLSVYLAQLEVAQQDLVRQMRAAVIAEMLSIPILGLTEQQQEVLKLMGDDAGTFGAEVAYAQPSALRQWQMDRANLLTLSRAGTFPFDIPVLVVIR